MIAAIAAVSVLVVLIVVGAAVVHARRARTHHSAHELQALQSTNTIRQHKRVDKDHGVCCAALALHVYIMIVNRVTQQPKVVQVISHGSPSHSSPFGWPSNAPDRDESCHCQRSHRFGLCDSSGKCYARSLECQSLPALSGCMMLSF